MAEDDENTEVWSDGTPEAPVAPAPLTTAAPPAPTSTPASKPGLPIWLIAGGVVLVLIVLAVGGVFLGRLMGASKATTAPAIAATASTQSDTAPPAAASAAAPPAPEPSAVALTAGQQIQCDSLAGQNVTF